MMHSINSIFNKLIISVALFAPLILINATSVAHAKSKECRILERNLHRGFELVTLDKIEPEAKAIKRAIAIQKKQISQEKRTFKALKCNQTIDGFYSRNASRKCPFVANKIERMRFNLSTLNRELAYFKRHKVRVEINPTYTRLQMQKAGCFRTAQQQKSQKTPPQKVKSRQKAFSNQITRVAIPTPRPTPLANDIPATSNAEAGTQQVASNSLIPSTPSTDIVEQKKLEPIKKEKQQKVAVLPKKPETPKKLEITKPNTEEVKLTVNTNTYRTMCVRTCDGYYFEVSKSTLKSQFKNDQEACNAACPAAQTELFFHKVPDGQIKNMTSAKSGIPYTIQNYAYRFRDGQSKTCSCQSQNKSN